MRMQTEEHCVSDWTCLNSGAEPAHQQVTKTSANAQNQSDAAASVTENRPKQLKIKLRRPASIINQQKQPQENPQIAQSADPDPKIVQERSAIPPAPPTHGAQVKQYRNKIVVNLKKPTPSADKSANTDNDNAETSSEAASISVTEEGSSAPPPQTQNSEPVRLEPEEPVTPQPAKPTPQQSDNIQMNRTVQIKIERISNSPKPGGKKSSVNTSINPDLIKIESRDREILQSTSEPDTGKEPNHAPNTSSKSNLPPPGPPKPVRNPLIQIRRDLFEPTKTKHASKASESAVKTPVSTSQTGEIGLATEDLSKNPSPVAPEEEDQLTGPVSGMESFKTSQCKICSTKFKKTGSAQEFAPFFERHMTSCHPNFSPCCFSITCKKELSNLKDLKAHLHQTHFVRYQAEKHFLKILWKKSKIDAEPAKKKPDTHVSPPPTDLPQPVMSKSQEVHSEPVSDSQMAAPPQHTPAVSEAEGQGNDKSSGAISQSQVENISQAPASVQPQAMSKAQELAMRIISDPKLNGQSSCSIQLERSQLADMIAKQTQLAATHNEVPAVTETPAVPSTPRSRRTLAQDTDRMVVPQTPSRRKIVQEVNSLIPDTPSRRKPGRPRKDASREKVTENIDLISPSPRKQTGRPKKESSSGGKVHENIDLVSPSPKKPGRPKKSGSQVEAGPAVCSKDQRHRVDKRSQVGSNPTGKKVQGEDYDELAGIREALTSETDVAAPTDGESPSATGLVCKSFFFCSCFLSTYSKFLVWF